MTDCVAGADRVIDYRGWWLAARAVGDSGRTGELSVSVGLRASWAGADGVQPRRHLRVFVCRRSRSDGWRSGSRGGAWSWSQSDDSSQ